VNKRKGLIKEGESELLRMFGLRRSGGKKGKTLVPGQGKERGT